MKENKTLTMAIINELFFFSFIKLQEKVQAKDPPSHYLAKLRTYLDPKASRSHRVSKIVY